MSANFLTSRCVTNGSVLRQPGVTDSIDLMRRRSQQGRPSLENHQTLLLSFVGMAAGFDDMQGMQMTCSDLIGSAYQYA